MGAVGLCTAPSSTGLPSLALRKAHAYGPVVAAFIYTKGSHAEQGN